MASSLLKPNTTRVSRRKPPPADGSDRRSNTTTSLSMRRQRRWSFRRYSFPSENPTVAIVASLATYGVGYVARPIGAFVLGHWGDTHGRKTVLILCMFLMGISTMLVGLLPTYQQVGMLAPVLLVILRLIQGFAVAGEISGASSMILEHAPFGRRGFYASFTLQGVQAGQILAAAVFLPLAAYMPTEAFNSWGWRIPVPAQLLRHRRRLHHPSRSRRDAGLRQGGRSRATFRKRRSSRPFKHSWRDMLRVVCMALMNVIPVVATIFGAAYAVQPAYGIGFEKDVYLWIPVLGNMLAVFVIPIVGNLSDKVGRKPPIIVGALCFRTARVRLSLRDQHQERAAGDLHVAVDVGRRLPGLQRDLPELLSRTVPDADPGLGDGDLPEHRDDHHGAASGTVCDRGASRLDQHPPHRRRNRLRYHRDRSAGGCDCPGNLPDQHQRSRKSRRRSDGEGRIREASAEAAASQAVSPRRAKTARRPIARSHLDKCEAAAFEASRTRRQQAPDI